MLLILLCVLGFLGYLACGFITLVLAKCAPKDSAFKHWVCAEGSTDDLIFWTWPLPLMAVVFGSIINIIFTIVTYPFKGLTQWVSKMSNIVIAKVCPNKGK